jgi:hypothetical protein
MNNRGSFLRDTRHLQVLFALLLLAGLVAAGLRSQMIPVSYGQYGPYRGDALHEVASLPQILPTDANCIRCHTAVHEERKDSPHTAVQCSHCHGIGKTHMAQALAAAASSDVVPEAAKEWDGHFPSQVDLFITKDRAVCLSCHQTVVGMPPGFRSIDASKHLEEQGAETPSAADVCFECHTGHSPGI